MERLPIVLLLGLGLTNLGSAFSASVAAAQEAPAGTLPNPGGMATPPRVEPAVDALTRRDAGAVALTLRPGSTLLLHDFDFNGEPVATDKIHLHQLSPGVYELLSNAYTTGSWRFQIADSAAYYGLGAHSDTLDHAHTVARNLAMTVPAPRGSTTPAPVPFVLSTTGYGLWLDTAADATFDLNASDPANIIVDVSTARLRIVLFTGEKGRAGQFPALLAAYKTLVPAAPGALSFDFDDLRGGLTALLSASLSGLPFPPSTAMQIPANPDAATLARWIQFLAWTPSAPLALPPGVPAGVVAMAKRYASIHTALAPYLAVHANLEPLVFEFQDEPGLHEIRDEYLLGPGVLVAPAFDQNSTRLVYLPAGEWKNLFTGEKFTGPRTILAATPAEEILVYVRTDADLPNLTPAVRPAAQQEP